MCHSPGIIAHSSLRGTTEAPRSSHASWTLLECPSQSQAGAAPNLRDEQQRSGAGGLAVPSFEEVLADGHGRQVLREPPLRVDVGARIGVDVKLLERTDMEDRDVEG